MDKSTAAKTAELNLGADKTVDGFSPLFADKNIDSVCGPLKTAIVESICISFDL